MNLESPKVSVDKSQEGIFSFITNLKNFEGLMPDSIEKFEVDGDSFIFGLKGMPEIRLVLQEKNEFDKLDNPLKNAPHTYLELASNEWKHKYTREEAAFPSEHLRHNKYWAPVARVDNVYGDRNLVCSCPSMDEYKDEAA